MAASAVGRLRKGVKEIPSMAQTPLQRGGNLFLHRLNDGNRVFRIADGAPNNHVICAIFDGQVGGSDAFLVIVLDDIIRARAYSRGNNQKFIAKSVTNARYFQRR